MIFPLGYSFGGLIVQYLVPLLFDFLKREGSSSASRDSIRPQAHELLSNSRAWSCWGPPKSI